MTPTATVTALPVTPPPPEDGLTVLATLGGVTLLEVPASGTPAIDQLPDTALGELWAIVTRTQQALAAWAACHLEAS